MRNALVPAVLLAVSGAVFADTTPFGFGTVTPSGSVFTTEITPADTDDYVFQGFPGTSLTVTLKLAKGSALKPQLQVYRPDGSLLSDDDRLVATTSTKGATAKVVLDTPGWWTVRVLGHTGSGTTQVNTAGPYSISIKYSNPVVPPLPAESKSFSVTGTIDSGSDVDDFAFQGYAGQSINATLSVAKTSGLNPQFVLIRPDGSSASETGTGDAQKKLIIARSLDATGTWKLRVIGEETDPAPPNTDATTGPYGVKVKLGKAIGTGLVPDGNHQYRLAVPAMGDATVGYTLTFTGSAPIFNSFRDPTGKPVANFPGGLSVKGFKLAADLPIGDYSLVFDAPSGTPTNVNLSRTLVLPKGKPKVVAKFDKFEPTIRTGIGAISPTEGGPGTILLVQTNNIVDPGFPDTTSPNTKLGLFLDHFKCEPVTLQPDGITLRGVVPANLPEGIFDVVVVATSGQAAVRPAAFRRVPGPKVTSIDPDVGTEGGGFKITITGSNFRPGKMGILLENVLLPVTPDADKNTETSVTFTAPARPASFTYFGVKDTETGLVANFGLNTFEYVATPAISRIVPSLIPIFGNEIITVQGANFSAQDTVYLETTTPGVFETITTPSNPTYISSRQHQFIAPVRPKGIYKIHVQDSQGQPNPIKSRNLTYYSFAELATNLGTIGNGDRYDAYSSSLGDFDKDGDLDVFISRRGNSIDSVPNSDSQTRVLRNDGNGQFTDVTETVMPSISNDDWRADRIFASDLNNDGYADIYITTNTKGVPTAGKSHTRILINEALGGAGGPTQRVFRDVTPTAMAPVRTMTNYGAGGDYVSDDWRGLDMFVGDVDKGPAGPPEIIITHDEVKDDSNSNGVACGKYCPTQGGSYALAYIFYWGGSRFFRWDQTLNGGQGRYKFDHNFFPRMSGPLVPTPTPNGQIPSCHSRYNTGCKDRFTPFIGQRVAVGQLDPDTKPDVIVLSNKTVSRKASKATDPLLPTSSMQIGINKFNSKDGAGITDITGDIFAFGGQNLGDTITIGHPGYPDGGSQGVIAFGFATTGGGVSSHLFKFTGDNVVPSFEDITPMAMPPVQGGDTFQASRIEFRDIDLDGDEDLVFEAAGAPSSMQSAFRVYRNEREGTNVGVFKRSLMPLIDDKVTPTEHYEGDFVSIGDLTGDGFPDYVISRAATTGSGPQTRIVRTDK